MNEIEEAVFAAAESGFDFGAFCERRQLSDDAVRKARNTIRRFLENVDEGLTAHELREALENGDQRDGE